MALSHPAGELLARLDAPAPQGFDCDVLIVGSGYGAAVAAARMAGAQLYGDQARVWLLERGAERALGGFPSRFTELPSEIRFSMQDGTAARGRPLGLLDLRLGPDVNVLLGNGLGGGSLINANVMVEPPTDVWGKTWPAVINGTALKPYYQAAKAMLGAKPYALDHDLGKLRALRALAGELPVERPDLTVAWKAGPSAAGVEMAACTLCGDCLTGCNVGAKGSLDTNYLVHARRCGVEMFTGASVFSLGFIDGPKPEDKGWAVSWKPTDPGAVGAEPRAIRARRVVLAAGSLGSTEILLRSKTSTLKFSDRLGQSFSMNGASVAAGLGHAERVGAVAAQESDPADMGARFVGPTICGLLRVPADGAKPAFIVEEFGVPGALRRVFGEAVSTLGMLRGGRMSGGDPVLCTDTHIDHMSLYGLLGRDDAAGRLIVGGTSAVKMEEGSLRVRWESPLRQPLFDHMNDWLTGRQRDEDARGYVADLRQQMLQPAAAPAVVAVPNPPDQLVLLGETDSGLSAAWAMLKATVKAGAKKAVDQAAKLPVVDQVVTSLRDLLLSAAVDHVPPPELLALLADSNLGLALTVHPLGGCGMGDDHLRGVVNACGQVFNPASGGVHWGLAVLDGSILPCALGCNPALTITALAERAMGDLAKGWQLGMEAQAPKIVQLPARLPGRRRELPPERAIWRLRERLQGRFGDYWARLEMSYEDIPGFNRALQLPDRVINVHSGRLELFDMPEGWPQGRPEIDDLVTLRGAQKPLWRAEVSGSLRLFARLAEFRPLPEKGDIEDDRVTLDYRLSIQGLTSTASNGRPCPLRVGGRLDARKVFGIEPEDEWPADRPPRPVSLLRQLSEASVSYDGKVMGRWFLDMDDLAQRREALLRLVRHSSLADAIGDAGVGALYVARRALPLLAAGATQALVSGGGSKYLMQRFPGRTLGLDPQPNPDFKGNHTGARLSLYEHPNPDGAPVLLLHGMGASGSSFTHESLRKDSPHLLEVLHGMRRTVWVLDVRSSIGNEFGRKDKESKNWTADLIAHTDVADAIKHVHEASKEKIDVFAHCMGGVMFWMALLSNKKLGKLINRAVVSQTAFMLNPTGFNRLRGYLASYLLAYLRLEEVDTRPDQVPSVSRADNSDLSWTPHKPGARQIIVDAALGHFPYQDDDLRERERQRWQTTDWRVRQRADAIFGQLFQLDQIHPQTVDELDALLGWVKMPMLAQAIHFARERMLTDVNGRNVWLDPDTLREHLPFPVLLLHGRNNRVFDWVGGKLTLRALEAARGAPPSASQDLRTVEVEPNSAYQHYGDGMTQQLIIFERYGHFDTVIGRWAGRDVFPKVKDFLTAVLPAVSAVKTEKKQQVWSPGIGPVQGWLRAGTQEGWYASRVLLRPDTGMTGPFGMAFVPVRWRGGVPKPQLDAIMLRACQRHFDPRSFDIWYRDADLNALASSFIVLLLSEPVPAGDVLAGLPHPHGEQLPLLQVLHRREGGSPLPWLKPASDTAQKIEAWFAGAERNVIDAAQLTLAPQRLAAADGESKAAELRFALGSCQAPPDLFDMLPAGASYERLNGDTLRDDGPQFLLQVGDQVYLDATGGLFDPPNQATPELRAKSLSTSTEREIRHSYELNLQMLPLRRTLARLPVYPLLDDHEVRNDWAGLQDQPDPPHVDLKAALAAYEDYQHCLAPSSALLPGDRASNGYSYRFAPGGLPFFVLDTRSRRNANTGCIAPPLLMAELIKALRDASRDHPDLPKFIAMSTPLLPPDAAWARGGNAARGQDGWAAFAQSAAELLQAIRDDDIRGVVLLSGDSHLSSVSRFSFKGPLGQPNEVVSIVSSGFYSPWPFINTRPEELITTGDLTLGGVSGDLSLEAMSTANGYASVIWRRPVAGASPAGSLDVRLCGGNMSTVTCRLELG